MRLIRNRTTARRIRFHAAWLGLLMLVLDAVSQMWFAFESWLPISPEVYTVLGIALFIASGIGHLYRN
jgi:hypothetical protein